MDKKIALVTGANKGIGFEACRQLAKNGFKVILTSRDGKKGKNAAEKLKNEGSDVIYYKLDVTSKEDIDDIFNFVKKEFGRSDVLVNNAGILIDAHDGVLDIDIEKVKKTVEANTYGPFLMCQKFIPLMQKNNYGRIINLSSGLGQLSDMSNGYIGYRISKTALNVVTRVFASETSGYNIKVNSVCPGWVKTDMGGPNAERMPEKACETIVWLALLSDEGVSGGFFRDKRPIGW